MLNDVPSDVFPEIVKVMLEVSVPAATPDPTATLAKIPLRDTEPGVMFVPADVKVYFPAVVPAPS